MMPMRGTIDSAYCQSIHKDCWVNNHGREVDNELVCTSAGSGYDGCFIKNGGSRRLQTQGSKPHWMLV
jgi:hypothetical protein